MSAPLPFGFRVRIAPDVIEANHGRTLVGGSPLTALTLQPSARALIRGGEVVVNGPVAAQVADRLLATNLGQPLPGSRVAVNEVTVVVPVRDRPTQLDRTLRALEGLRCIVVDDASRDRLAVAEVAERHAAELVALDHNVGPAAARNIGLARITTSFVAFVDSDVEVTSHALLELTRHFQDPKVCLVGPLVQGVARSRRPRWFESYDASASSLSLGRRPGVVRPGSGVAWLPGACLVARRDALGDGFDARMRVGEDVDLVWRLTANEGRVRYDPTVVALHDARTTVRDWLGRKFLYGTGGAALATKHGNRLAPAILTVPYAVAAAAVLHRRRWALPAAVGAVLWGTRAVGRSLPPQTTQISVRLAGRGLGWAVRQEAALVLRHWWPVMAGAACVSRNARRVLTTALLIDTAVALAERADEKRHGGSQTGIVTHLVGRRCDDAAYGAGLWWGAVRTGSGRALLVRAPSRPGSVSRGR